MLPSFKTDRLWVRPRCLTDLDECLAMDRDPQVTRLIIGPWADPSEHRNFVVERMKSSYPDGFGYWSVIHTESNQLLGWVLLLPYIAVKNEIEIGWRFVRKNWRQGFATEAATEVLRHAFLGLGLGLIVADINPLNLASMRVAEKLGLKPIEDRLIEGEKLKSYQINTTQFRLKYEYDLS